jgi:phosphatidylglycerol:prolipoprotein diacylglycerol transferase
MASHGGMMGVIIASWFIARGYKDPQGVVREKVPWMHMIDLTAIACTPGLMLGRIANFINGELLGKIVAMPGEPAPWWAVKFPQEVLSDPMPHGHAPPLTPDQAHQLAALVNQEPFHGSYERVLQTLQSGGAKGAQVAQQLAPLISARYPSQLMQAATDGLVLGTVLWLLWLHPRKPGVIGCSFLILYGLLRIATEFIRLPDPQLAILKETTGLSMGQWLSVMMVLLGGAGLIFVLRRDVPKIGGWRQAAH